MGQGKLYKIVWGQLKFYPEIKGGQKKFWTRDFPIL